MLSADHLAVAALVAKKLGEINAEIGEMCKYGCFSLGSVGLAFEGDATGVFYPDEEHYLYAPNP
jgi:hypothetical protein